MKISKYAKLGLLMVFSLTALIWGLSYLKGHDFFKPVDYYYTRYERVDGLQESGHVTFNGYRVGSVKNIRFADDRTGDLIVTFMLDNDFRIPVHSAARIVSSDIMGTRSVKLVFSNETSYYQAGDTLPGEIESDLKEQVSLQVLPLKNKAEDLLSTLDSAITVLTVIFNEDARKNLSQSFDNINRTISNLEKTSADLQTLMATEKSNISGLINNMKEFSGILSGNAEEFDNIVGKLSQFSDTLVTQPLGPVLADVSAAVNSLEEILAKANSDQSSAGLLLHDDQLYRNLTGLTSNLEYLLTDIRTNPKRYLHFSAIDLGKEVYVTSSGTPAENRNILFRVHLISVTQPLPADSPLFDGLGEIISVESSGAWSYLAGEFTRYEEATQWLVRAHRNFPDATIVAFREGKIIPLDKAMRLLKK